MKTTLYFFLFAIAGTNLWLAKRILCKLYPPSFSAAPAKLNHTTRLLSLKSHDVLPASIGTSERKTYHQVKFFSHGNEYTLVFDTSRGCFKFSPALS